MGVELDKWIERVKRCEHLAEEELKALCDYVCPHTLAASSAASLPHVQPS
jgi:hypothetical protein